MVASSDGEIGLGLLGVAVAVGSTILGVPFLARRTYLQRKKRKRIDEAISIYNDNVVSHHHRPEYRSSIGIGSSTNGIGLVYTF